MKRARRLWLNVHLSLGITVGVLFALLGLTGSVLTFYQEIDRTLNAEIRPSGSPNKPPSIQAIADRIKHNYPDRKKSWRIEMPMSADAPIALRYYRPHETAGKTFAPLMVTLDPVTLQESSYRFWGDYFVTWIYDLHYALLLDQTGKTIVGLSGLVILFLLLSGIYLWWPSARRFASSLLPILRPGAVRKTYDLHTRAGVYGLVILVVIALTGTGLAFPQPTRSLLENFAAVEAAPRPAFMPAAAGQPVIDLDQAVDIAREIFPDAELRWIETAGEEGNPISVRFHQRTEPGRRFAKTQVWIDPHTAEVLAVWDPDKAPKANGFLEWLHPLHNGEAFGAAGRWIVFLSGLLPALLCITGWMRWRQKKHAKLKR